MMVINTLINAVIESSPQPKIITPYFKLLSQFHLLIAIPFGTGKSSIAHMIPNSSICLNYTLPSIVGTINKQGQFVNSALIKSAKKIFTIDEGHRLSSKSVDALLSLLEQGYYDRTLGYKSSVPVPPSGNLDKDGFSMVPYPEGNGFTLNVRFSCIWFGEKIYKFHQKAFLSRFFPMLLEPTEELIERYQMGEPLLEFKPRKRFKIYSKETVLSKNVYDYLMKKHIEIQRKYSFPNDQLGYKVRAGGQIIKLASHFARVRGSLRVEERDCNKALEFSDLCLQNYKLVQLTPLEVKIYHLIFVEKLNQYEAAERLGIEQSLVSKYISKLKTKGVFTTV